MNNIFKIVALFSIPLIAAISGLISIFIFADDILKIMTAIYLIETFLPINFIGIGHVLTGLLAFSVVCLFIIWICVDVQFNEYDKEKFEKFKEKNLPRFINTVIFLIVFGLFGSFMNTIKPKKETVYLMAGVYVSSKAIDNCTSENTICYKMIKSINVKALQSLEKTIGTANDVINKTGEIIENSSNKSE